MSKTEGSPARDVAPAAEQEADGGRRHAEERTKHAPWVLLAIVPLLAAVGLCRLLPDPGFHMAVTKDSFMYVEAAEHFSHGLGLTIGRTAPFTNVTHWPPLYPIMLGSGIKLGETAERTAAFLNSFCFGIALLFFGAVTLRLSKSAAAAVAMQAMTAVTWMTLGSNVYVLSEPPFLALEAAALYVLVEYERSGSLARLAEACVLIQIATMTRFAGLGLLAGAVIWLLLRKGWKGIAAAATFGACGILPVAVWVLLHHGDGGAGVGRHIGFVMPETVNLNRGLLNLGAFVAPDLWPAASVEFLGVLVLSILAVGSWFRRTRLVGVMALVYLAFLVTSLIVGDAAIGLDRRMLLPVLPLTMIIVISFLAVFVRNIAGRQERAFALCILLILLFNYMSARAAESRRELIAGIEQGFSFEGPVWRNSEILQFARRLPPDVVLVSGEGVAVRYWTKREVAYDPIGAASPQDHRVRTIRTALRNHRRYVLLDGPHLNDTDPFPRVAHFSMWFDLVPLAQTADGSAYWLRERKD
jgi:hypothetical protein